MSDYQDTELVVQQDGAVIQAILNRPAALNALSLEMIRMLSAGLLKWRHDKDVKAVFFDGAGDQAFCAGGDVKSTYKTGMSYRQGKVDEKVISLFFGEEYCMNRQLFHFPKPLFAFMNGITMGGGFGVAGPCRYRIASERTVFAMPEVAIGFFPDVGSTYFLNRAPGQIGAFLALTGGRIEGADMLYSGLASHFVPWADQEDLKNRLRKTIEEIGAEDLVRVINEILAAYTLSTSEAGMLERNIETINRCFDGDSVPVIIERLRQEGSEWALQQADIIASRSPVSLKVSIAHLRKTKNRSFDQVTAQDFILAQHFTQGHDFYEGVRAMLVDKDKTPQWEPQTLEEVDREMVERYFQPTGPALDEIAA